ncbi:MAG: ROK family protein [Cyanobacteria bacterium P01_H01_bin.15]
MTEKTVLGIDLGGTAIKFGRFDEAGNEQASLTLKTPQPTMPEAVMDRVAAGIAEIRTSQTIGIGIGTPGPSCRNSRIARIAINLDNWIDIPVADMLERMTALPTIVENDANCAALGEAWLGAGKTYQDFVLLTLGTGVGGAVIMGGDLFLGRKGAAGELGLVTVNLDGPPCNSGNSGSLEQYCSVTAIRRNTGKDPSELARLAAEGDNDALQFWTAYGRLLGAGLASSVYILTPEAVVIGGGVSASAPFFFPSAEAELARRVMPTSHGGVELVVAALGNKAGITGAAKLAWQRAQT